MHIYSNFKVEQSQEPMFYGLLVPGSASQGTRKVKNITLKFISTELKVPLIFAVIYVPEGIEPDKLKLARCAPTQPVSLYEPAQNVIMHGQFVTQASGPQVFHSRLARNLQSNDAIYILFTPLVKYETEWSADIDILCNYAICY
jgi:hypothetical protein